jgi:hypothetical protein
VPNVNRIFGLFSDGEDKSQPQEIHVDFMETPDAKIGMFVKLIQNNIVFNEKLKQFFKKAQQEFDEEVTKQSSEFTVFNRAWYYVKGIDIDNKEHLYAVIKQDTQYLLDSLERAIKYFEDREEYEKCAHIHKIEKIVKEI